MTDGNWQREGHLIEGKQASSKDRQKKKKKRAEELVKVKLGALAHREKIEKMQ